MTLLTQSILLVLFLVAAGWQLAVGSMPSAKPLPAPMQVKMPAPPAGWQIVEDKPLTNEAKAPGRLTTYKAPDGTRLSLERRVACPDRRDMPLTFFPRECTYLAEGWDFDERSGLQPLAPGIACSRIQVRRNKEKLVDLEAYGSEGKVRWGWHVFKWELIGQRLRRERPVWVLAHLVTPAEGEAARAANDLMLAALTEPPATGEPPAAVVVR